MTHRLPLLRLAAFLFLAFAQASNAALFDDDEARRRIADTNARLGQIQRELDARLVAIEQQLKSGGLVDLANQMEQLKGDVAKLRGQIEVLVYELGEAQKRQRDLYVDLDSRMRKIETAQPAAPVSGAPPATPAAESSAPVAGTVAPVPSGAVPAAPPAGPAVAPPIATARPADPAAEQRAYDAALDLFKRGDYGGAIGAFGTFVRTYPRAPLASSAQYWIGNAHFARRDYKASITAQRTLIANYPDSAKVPDALLNIASAQGELGDNAGARRTLEELAAKHPQSDAGQKAKQRLAGR